MSKSAYWFNIEYITNSPGISEVGLNFSGRRYKYRADSAVIVRFKAMYHNSRRKLPALDYLKSKAISVKIGG